MFMIKIMFLILGALAVMLQMYAAHMIPATMLIYPFVAFAVWVVIAWLIS